MKKSLQIFSVAMLFAVLSFNTTSFAQLSVTGGYTAQQLTQTLIGTGITASNFSMAGAPQQFGKFNGVSSNIGLNSGILICTGNISYAPGPNLFGDDGDDNFGNGDPALDALCGYTTYDAGILEFDFVPTTNNISFRYVFASEEYNEWVCGSVNDVFAFYISGPGFTGSQNIALIPSTNTPVSINSVNIGAVGLYGSSATLGCILSNSSYFVDNTNGTTVGYDGFTKALTAKATVTAGATYHIRLAIADAGDGIYDSGVFIEAGSFSGTSPNPTVTVNGSTVCPSSCTTLSASAASGTAPYTYSWSPNIGSGPGPFSVCPSVNTIYTVVVTDNAGKTVSDTALVSVYTPVSVNAGPDVTICIGSSTQLNVTGATGGSTISWSPASGLTCTACSNPSANPTSTTSYLVTVTSPQGCNGTDGVTVNVSPKLVLNFTRDYYICAEAGGTVQLTASGGTSYHWASDVTLDDTTIANPLATPFVNTTYIVTVSNGICFDTAHVTVHFVAAPSPPVITTTGDTLSVPQIYLAYQWYYEGSPINGATGSSYMPTATGHYTVYVTDFYGCKVISQSVFITTGIPIINNGGLVAYPDPVTSELFIKGSISGKATVEVYNVLGELVYSRANELHPSQSDLRLDFTSLSKGMYFVQICNSDKLYRVRVVKE